MVTKYGNLSESDLLSHKTFFTQFDLYFILLLLKHKKLNEWSEYRTHLLLCLLTTMVCYVMCWDESVTSLTINIYDCPGSSWWNDDCDGSKEWWCLQLSQFPPKYAVIASLARSEPW